MSFESDWVASMLAHAPLAALIGQRLTPDKVEQGAPRPYCVYIIEREPTYLIDNTLAAELFTVKVQSWADTRTEAEAVADALDAALAASTLEPGGIQRDTRDYIAEHELDFEGVQTTFEFWLDHA